MWACFYSVMLVNGIEQHYIGNLELDSVRHTTLNIKEQLNVLLKDYLPNIKAIVTDSPNVMVRMRQDFCEENSQIIPLRCVLHQFNLVCKGVFSHPSIKPMVKEFTTMATFFTSSGYWKNKLKNWGSSNEGSFISTFVEVRWYSFVKMCLSLKSFENGMREMVKRFQDGEGPLIPVKVINIVNSTRTFKMLNILSTIMKPIADSITYLERGDVNIGHVCEATFKMQLFFDKYQDDKRFLSAEH